MSPNRTRQDDALEIGAFLDEIFELIAVRDMGDILLDDGAVVEGLGHVVTARYFTPRRNAG